MDRLSSRQNHILGFGKAEVEALQGVAYDKNGVLSHGQTNEKGGRELYPTTPLFGDWTGVLSRRCGRSSEGSVHRPEWGLVLSNWR